MIRLFHRPYKRIATRKEKVTYTLLFGLFVFIFLFLFRPFGMSQIKTSTMFLLSFGFGVVTIFVLLVFRFLLEPVVINDRWTFGKSLLWSLLIALSIGAANYFYAHIIFHKLFILNFFPNSVWTAVLVGFIPASVGYIISFNRIYREALREASISPYEVIWEDEVIIRGGNPRNEFKYNPRKIVYLCSNDNYITVVSVRDHDLNKVHMRGTLKDAEKELKKNTSFIRCHKCYIINLEYIDHLTGNIQNLKIKLKSGNIEIPVSRGKASELIRRFR
jgi:hypothetical protein